MESDNKYRDVRAVAFSAIAELYEKDKFAGYYGGIGILKGLGVPNDEAELLMAELANTLDHNSLPGEVISLPEFDPNSIPTPELMNFDTQIHGRAAYFTLGYIEDATSRDFHSVVHLGEYWLGNSTEETKKLINSLQQDPDKAAGYVRWAFQNDPSLENMLSEFEEKAASNTLRPPNFD